jgi:hypothetical protein
MAQIVAAFIGAVASTSVWFMSARHLKKQERDATKREIRLQYLIDAYRRIERSSNRHYHHDSQYARDYESAIADIQLFGNAKQIELAQYVAKQFASQGSASCDNLLEELRKDLRAELDLEQVTDMRVIVRIEETEAPNRRLQAMED